MTTTISVRERWASPAFGYSRKKVIPAHTIKAAAAEDSTF